MVEHQFVELRVAGSSPVGHPKNFFKALVLEKFFCVWNEKRRYYVASPLGGSPVGHPKFSNLEFVYQTISPQDTNRTSDIIAV